jgi:DNA-binding transcriptional ArsR family regulator
MGEYRKPGFDRVLGAIADPTRRAILARLAESDARITEVASAFPISLNSVSKHRSYRESYRSRSASRRSAPNARRRSIACPLRACAPWKDGSSDCGEA